MDSRFRGNDGLKFFHSPRGQGLGQSSQGKVFGSSFTQNRRSIFQTGALWGRSNDEANHV